MTFKVQEHKDTCRVQAILVKPREDSVIRVNVQYIEAYQTDCATGF